VPFFVVLRGNILHFGEFLIINLLLFKEEIIMKRPLIFDFCTPRRSDEKKSAFYYDFDKNLNMVNLNGKGIPFVDYGTKAVEMITKTFTQRESDNEVKAFFELETFTEVARESDEENNIMMSRFFELETNTRVQREASDVDLNVGLLELETRTDVAREREDD